ncbi:hypothetical protein HWV62_7954 [Athelia sp. TMB]|nr:hypothetical protein HWV62_7954 [Athelia sp. TMB]
MARITRPRHCQNPETETHHAHIKAMMDCFNIPELMRVVLADCSTNEIISFRKTCKIANKAVHGFELVAFNIDWLLKRFLDSPDMFRKMQARTGTVIGGTTALAFFERTTHEEASMDIYVNPGHSYEVARHLTDMQGFSYHPFGSANSQEFTYDSRDGESDRLEANHRQESVYAIRAIDNVHRFTKGEEGRGLREIFLIKTTRSPLHAILNSHSTMNLITHDTAISLYPRATFIQRENQELFWNMLHTRDSTDTITDEYERKGYTKVTWRNRSEAKCIFRTGESRRVGDDNCWSIKLKQFDSDHDVQPSSTSHLFTQNIIQENTWKLVGADTLTRWDGKVRVIQSGKAEVIDYTGDPHVRAEEVADREDVWNPEVEGPDEVTESTISERSYFDAHPVLINSRMKSKTIKEILGYYRKANEGGTEKP